MLSVVSKQAQLLTTKDDASLLHPYRAVGRYLSNEWQKAKRPKLNDKCLKCNSTLLVDRQGKSICPQCTSQNS